MVILAAQLEVAHDNGDFGAGQYENHEHDKEEAKDVVEVVTPDGRKDEEQFDEYSTKRQDSSHQDRKQGAHVPHLFGNLSWNLIGPHWVISNRFLVREVTAKEHQGHRDTEPQCKQCQQSNKWDGTRRFLSPNEQVQNEENSKNNSRKGKGGHDSVSLPLSSLEHSVGSSREVASEHTHNNKQDDHSSHQSTTICW